jgi:HEAT repeat protein
MSQPASRPSAKVDPVKAELLRLRSVGAQSAEMGKALTNKSPKIVALAAKMCAEAQLSEMGPNLIQAFERFLGPKAPPDRGCYARTALAKALTHLEIQAESLYRTGTQIYLPEYSGDDAAAELRGYCAIGLARTSRQALDILLELLADPHPNTRALAATAIGEHGIHAGQYLLKLRLLSNEEHPHVIGECLAALLQMDPEGAVAFLEKHFLRSHPELAIDALAQARQHQALLRIYPDHLKDLLPALAMTGHSEAVQFLLELIKNAPTSESQLAAKSLQDLRPDSQTQEKIADALSQRTSR